MKNLLAFTDDLGPRKVVALYEPSVDLQAIVVVDNVACGPAIGGVRMAKDVTVEECFRLARAMSFKNAAAGLPHGGGKSVIAADPAMPAADKERLIRAFAQAIRGIDEYIPGPDMGTDERCMAWVKDEIGRSVGLPPEIGGIPLDRIGATGLGVTVAAEVACRHAGIPLEGARFVVQGFGSVGRHASRFLCQRGARLVGVSDSRGGRIDPDGLDLDALLAHKAAGGSVSTFPGGRAADGDALIAAPAEIWIPAARPDVLHEGNADRLQARMVVSGANIPITATAETMLERRGVLLVPDFIANAGGVIAAAVEYAGGTERQALAIIEDKVRANTEAVLDKAGEEGMGTRKAAVALARERIEAARQLRRWR